MASERQEAWNSRMVHEKCLPGVYPSISPDVQRVKIGRPPGIRFECFSFLPKAGETSVNEKRRAYLRTYETGQCSITARKIIQDQVA